MKVVVKPIDRKGRGSYAVRLKYLAVYHHLHRADPVKDFDDWYAAQQEADALVRERAYVEDEGTMEEALAEITAEEFDQLFFAILGGNDADAIPPKNSSSSTDGPEDTASTLPIG